MEKLKWSLWNFTPFPLCISQPDPCSSGIGGPGAAPLEASPGLGSFAHQGLCVSQGTVLYQHLLRMELHPKVKLVQLPPHEPGARVPEEPSSPGTPGPLTATLQPGERHRAQCHEEVPQGSPSAGAMPSPTDGTGAGMGRAAPSCYLSLCFAPR